MKIFSLFSSAAALATLAASPAVHAASANSDDAFLRTQAVFNHFQVPEEPDSQPLLDHLHGQRTLNDIQAILPYLDPASQFSRFATVNTAPNGRKELRVFQDIDSKRYLDYFIELAEDGTTRSSDALASRLSQPRPKDRPLSGLKIAIDPGHMGGNKWDTLSGKYVRDGKGRRLSEGLLVLQLALLLEKDLKQLGAEVLLTRRGLNPATDLPYENFDLTPFALAELRSSSLADWFRSLLFAGKTEKRVYSAFQQSPRVKRIFSNRMRWLYYFHRADLSARIDTIQAFAPDITLILHLDAFQGPSIYNGTKAYVPGGFLPTEFSTREDRMFFAQHILDPRTWNTSVRLSRAMVSNISSRMNVPFDNNEPASQSTFVEPGIFARNLALLKRLPGTAITYLEGLFYNYPTEFEALLQARHPLMIDGVDHPYSDRLAELKNALVAGMIEFVTSSRAREETLSQNDRPTRDSAQ